MRIVFMGTPDFAVGSLQALAEAGKYEIVSVITQPDRPKGRGRQMLMTPVKEYALSQGYEVHQPQRVKTPEFVAQLREMNPDLIVVAAFGQLLSKNIAEQKIIIRLVLSVLQELLEDAAHCSVKRYYQSLSILSHSYIDHIIIEINVFNSDVH